MTAIRVAVEARHIAFGAPATDRRLWAVPVEAALAELVGQTVSIDGGSPCVATIGTRDSAWTVVVDLPAEASDWLDARWETGVAGDPFTFEIEVPEWVRALVGPVEWVTLRQAAEELGVKPVTLRRTAWELRDGGASPLAERLGAQRIGRDWLIPRNRLDAEIARRR